MCISNALQQKIRKRTGNGDLIVNFLADTVEGKYRDAKYHHKLEAAKWLDRYGFSHEPDHEKSKFRGLLPTPEELATSKEEDHSPLSPRERVRVRGNEEQAVTHLDILNYEIAHLIRQETAEGHTIAEFLAHVMTRRDKPYTPKKLRIRHADRMAAAREILRRGFGHFGRRRKLVVDADDDNNHDTNDYDTLHTDLAKRMREYSEHGTDAVRFLLDVMEGSDPDEPYTWHHRMSAAQELLRRGWDTNYDAITPDMLQDYWQDQQSPRLSIAQKKHLAGLPVSQDDHNTYDNTDYQALAQELRQQQDLQSEDHEAISPIEKSPLSPQLTRHSRESGNPDPLSPRERARACPEPAEGVRGSEEPQPSTTLPTSDESSLIEDDFDTPECYYEPLNPDDQAIFNYNTLMESGEFKEGEISIVPPSEAARREYIIALKNITEAAAADGVPLLPNPLAGKLHAPTIRSP